MSLWKSRVGQALLTAFFITLLQYFFIHHYISENKSDIETALSDLEAEKIIQELEGSDILDLESSKDSEFSFNPRVNEVCYRDPTSPDERVGRPLIMSSQHRHIVDDYLATKPLSVKKKQKIVPQAVTAFSSNHFHEHSTIVPSFFSNFPGQKVMVYDIGLSKQQVEFFKKNTTHYIYRKYDFSKYPAHAHTLMNMVFKLTIWIECLKEFKSCMWFDTSIWFTKNADVAIQKYAIEQNTDFVYYIHPAGHNIAWATHPEMFGYFPSNLSVFNELPAFRKMSMAGAVIIYDTEACRHGILKWALMCALVHECISPSSELWPKRDWHGIMYHDNHYCNGTTPKQRPYNCHRYDQSLLSILVNNFYHYNTTRFHLTQSDWIAMTKRVG